MSDGLQPLEPEEAVEEFLEYKQVEGVRDSTDYNYRGRLESFIAFCEEQGIENINDLTGRDLHKYRNWRSEGRGEGYGEVKKVTLHSNMKTVRDFLYFCYEYDALPENMQDKVPVPELREEEEVRDEMLDPNRAQNVLDYLGRHRYASRVHVEFMILWHTGCRLGALQALDLKDFDYDDRSLHFVHRPDTGTPLKNGKKSTRYVAVGDYEADVISDYIEHHRHDVTADYGREPLITSTQGRLSQTPIRNDVYRITQPCEYANECPHGKDQKTCKLRNRSRLAECPSSRSPHRLRDGRLTKHRLDGDPREVVSDRVDASEEIVDKHYDQRSDRQKMETRRRYIDDV